MQLGELGAFDDERVELIYGTLVAMTPQNPPHSSVVQRLNELLVLTFAGRASVRCQLPWIDGEYSLPLPDFAVVPLGAYDREHPAEACVLVEVADSSVRYDRGIKRQLYAEFGAREYWVVNIPERRIEVFSDPHAGAYRESRSYGSGERVRLAAFPDVEIAVDDVISR
jgi:Uma2 family endonuclease